MRRLLQHLSPLALGLAFACDAACGGSAPPPVQEPAAEPDPDPGPITAEPSPLMDAATMAHVAEGNPPLRDFVDPARGVVYVLYATDASGEDPRADDDGTIRLAEHWCDREALADGIDRLQRDLARRIREPIRDPLFECADGRCGHPAQMEYDVAGQYEFTEVEGREEPVLVAVEHVESAGMSERFLDEAEDFVRDQRAVHAGDTCE